MKVNIFTPAVILLIGFRAEPSPTFPQKLMVNFGFVLLLLLSVGSNAQQYAFPRGVYGSIESLRNGVPDRFDTLRIVQRTEKEIRWLGGNDYRLESDLEQFNWKHIHKHVLAYVHNDSIFLNGGVLNLESAFCLALTKGTYLAFYNYSESKNAGAVAAGGVLGGAIGALIATAATSGNPNETRELYVLSLKTGNAKRIGFAYVMARLNENLPELLEPYLQNADHDSDVVILRYLQMLNDALAKQTQK